MLCMVKLWENLRNRIDVRLVSNKKVYLKRTSKPSYMSQKIFDNDLVVILKREVTLTLNRPAYVGMCILDLSKLLLYEFHYDYIASRCASNSRLLFTDTDSLIYEIKTEDVSEGFSKYKEMLDFNNYLAKSKHNDDSNKLIVGKMKEETAGLAIEEFVGLKTKMYSFSVNNSSEHEKAKGVNKNVVATISHNKYKDVLLNNK